MRLGMGLGITGQRRRAEVLPGTPAFNLAVSLDGRTFTITATNVTGNPAPDLALATLTLNGVDVSGDATGTNPYTFVTPDGAEAQTVAGSVTATNSVATTTRTFSQSVPANQFAPVVEASSNLEGRTLTISVDSLTGTPTPDVALTTLTLDGADVIGDASGSGPWTYAYPDSPASQIAEWVITATNSVDSDTASGATAAPANQFAPVALTAPTITGDIEEGGTVTINEGTYSGTPAPTVSGVLTLDGVDVSGAMSGANYTLPANSAPGPLVWTETATNGIAPDASQSVSVTVQVADPGPDPGAEITSITGATDGIEVVHTGTITITGRTDGFLLEVA